MERFIAGVRQAVKKVTNTLGRDQVEIDRRRIKPDAWRIKSHKSHGNGTFLEATGQTLEEKLNPNQDLL